MDMGTEIDNNYVQIRVDIGELKGILTTVITEHGRRITDQEQIATKLRTDLTAVKDEGNRELSITNTRVTQNTSGIEELKSDMKEVKDKINGSWQKIWTVLAFCVGGAGLIWNILGGKT